MYSVKCVHTKVPSV